MRYSIETIATSDNPESADLNSVKVEPEIVFNRPDLQKGQAAWNLLCIEGKRYLFVKLENGTATVGSEYMDFETQELNAISAYLFRQHREIEEVDFPLINQKFGVWRNTYPKKIILPEKTGELDNRLSHKAQYNLRREKKRLDESVNHSLIIEEYAGDIPHELVSRFFELKRVTHGRDYGLSEEEYLETYCVDHAYVMNCKDGIIALLFSCEQCDCVYFENFTYDQQYAKWSPGMILYNYFLNSLVEKGKTIAYIGAGALDYKKKYDSIEEHRYYGTMYRSRLKTFAIQGKRKLSYYMKKLRK